MPYRDLTDTLTLDPRLHRCGISVTSLRLELDTERRALGRFDLAVALSVAGDTWPAGEFSLNQYNAAGLKVEGDRLFLEEELDPHVRHLTTASYMKSDTERFELLFKPTESPVAPMMRSSPQETWSPVPVEVDPDDERLLGLTMSGHSAEYRRDFVHANLLMVEVAGQVEARG